MDNYKFGNTLCRLREEHNLTQKELAEILNVSDKAVSKWENGQAIPRMDTLEKIAETLDTSVEELIVSSKENSKRICIINSYADIVHVEIDENLYSLKREESKWIELNTSVNEHILSVSGEITLNCENDFTEGSGIKNKLTNWGIKKLLNFIRKVADNYILQTNCMYKLNNLKDGESIEIEFDSFSIGDKAWVYQAIMISYPKLILDDSNAVLINAEGKNKKDFLKSLKKAALLSEIAIDIPLMLMLYPFRMHYFKSICKPKKLMEYINDADYYNEKEEKKEKKSKKRKHPVLKTIFILILFVVALFSIDFVESVLNVETEKPALIASDYSRIELFRDEYIRIKEMPFDAIPAKTFGIEVWHDARLDGLSKTDQALEDDKVTIFEDTNGKKYLWLLCDYTENFIDENGDYTEFEDFENPMVYEIVE